MDLIRELLDYQRFRKNKKLEARIAEVSDRYLSGGIRLDDDELEHVAAAGEPHPSSADEKPDGADDGSHG